MAADWWLMRQDTRIEGRGLCVAHRGVTMQMTERPFALRIRAAGGARVVMPEQMDAVDVTGGRRWTSEGAGIDGKKPPKDSWT
jgi:hypothetical protein